MTVARRSRKTLSMMMSPQPRHVDATGAQPELRIARRPSRGIVVLIAALAAFATPGFQVAGAAEQAAAGAQSEPPPARVFELRVEKRRLSGGVRTLRVFKGERIELRWTSDEATTLHLHGYDIEAAIVPGTPAIMSFEAYATGRFPLAAHGFGKREGSPGAATQQEATLLYLEVHPR